MINRQAMHGAGTKTSTKAGARTKLTKEAGARTTVKAKGRGETVSAAKPRIGAATRAPAGAKTRAAPGKRPSAAAPGAHASKAAWRGEEVAEGNPSAEEAATRAEGNGSVRADVLAHDPDHGTYTERGPARRPRANDPDAVENAEEKRRSAAEAHAAMPSRHFPHGRL